MLHGRSIRHRKGCSGRVPRLRDGLVYRPHSREATTTSRWARRLGSWWTHPDPMPAVCQSDCLTRSPDRPPRYGVDRVTGNALDDTRRASSALSYSRPTETGVSSTPYGPRDPAASGTIRAAASVSGQSSALRSEPRLPPSGGVRAVATGTPHVGIRLARPAPSPIRC